MNDNMYLFRTERSINIICYDPGKIIAYICLFIVRYGKRRGKWIRIANIP